MPLINNTVRQSRNKQTKTPILFLFLTGVSVHWLGDFVFVESGLGVRVKFDLANTVYLTVTAEHLAATRGLCGVYNNEASGKRRTKPRLSRDNRTGAIFLKLVSEFGPINLK